MYHIENITHTLLYYLRQQGPYGEGNRVLINKIRKLAPQHTIYAIAQDNPALTTASECRYDVGVTHAAHPSLQQQPFTDGKYAVFTIPHTVEGVTHFWAQLPTLALTIKDAPIIERYSEKMIAHAYCEMLVPIF